MSRAQELKRQLSLALQQSDWQEALGVLQHLVDSQDCQPGYYNQLGDLHLKLGDRSSAIASFLRGVESYRNLGMLPNGAALCKKIVRLEPDQKEAIWILGELKTRQGFLADGGDRLLEALRLYAEDPQTERQLLVDRMGEAEQLQGSNREMLEFVAITYAQIGERELARDVTIRIAEFEERAGRHENAQTMRRLAEQYVPEEMGSRGTASPTRGAQAIQPNEAKQPAEAAPNAAGQCEQPESAIPAMTIESELSDPDEQDQPSQFIPEQLVAEPPARISGLEAQEYGAIELESAIESVASPRSRVEQPADSIDKVWSIDPDELPDPIQAVEEWEAAVSENTEVLVPAPAIEETVQPLAQRPFPGGGAERPPSPSLESFAGAEPAESSLDYLSLTGGGTLPDCGSASVQPPIEATVSPAEDQALEPTPEEAAYMREWPLKQGGDDALSVGLSIHDSCPIQTDDALDVLSEFRSRLEEQADCMSAEERYQLGVSYMEMELHAEALTEFARVLADEQLGTKTREWMARCYIAIDRPREVLALLESHLADERPPQRNSVELYYMLGQAYESLGESRLAAGSFLAVQQLDPGFHDIAARLAKLRALT